MMNRNKAAYILLGVVIAFGSIAFLIGVVYPALADGTIYLPLISGNRSNIDSVAASKSGESHLTDTPTPGLKPGEYPGYVPTPMPEIPLPPGVEPVTPGAPVEEKPRPPQEELEKLIPPPLLPDALYQVGASYDVMPVSSEWVASLSEVIVVAKVHQIHSARWSTTDGKRPPNPHDRDNPAFILTQVDVQVEKVLLGDAQPNQILTLPQNGGQIGEEYLTIDSPYPAFAEGQLWVLYLSPFNGKIPGIPDDSWSINDQYLIDPATNLATNPFAQKSLEELIAEIARVQQQKQTR